MSSFVTADLHLGHTKMLTFLNPDGSHLRPFDSIEEMHDVLLTRWNNIVNPKDTVYVLGDVAIPRSAIKLMENFNGRKILIKGNHDIYKIKDYTSIFEDVRGAFFHPGDSTTRVGLIFTHVPVHPNCLFGYYRGNIHGHLHSQRVMKEDEIDEKYFNACVECNDFTPVPLEEVKKYFKL